jgi:hypothetical protein
LAVESSFVTLGGLIFKFFRRRREALRNTMASPQQLSNITAATATNAALSCDITLDKAIGLRIAVLVFHGFDAI